MTVTSTYTQLPIYDMTNGATSSAAAIETDVASQVVGFRSVTADKATSGFSYGGRVQHYVTGAQGGGAALRVYSLVKGVAADSLYGLECTAEIMSTASSSCDNEVYAAQFTLDINLSSSTSQSAVINLISDVASSKTVSSANHAFIKVGTAGAGTQTPAFLYIADAIGDKSDTALVTTTHAASTHTHSIRVSLAGTKAWIMCSTDNNSS